METPVRGSMVVRFSKKGLKTKCPLEVASQGKKVSWGRGVMARCKLFWLTALTGAVVGAGTAVGTAVGAVVGTPGTAVGAGTAVATGVAVADEPQATMKTRTIENSTAGFLRVVSSMTQPPDIGTPSIFQVAVR